MGTARHRWRKLYGEELASELDPLLTARLELRRELRGEPENRMRQRLESIILARLQALNE